MGSTGYNVIFLFIAGIGTALACGLGAIPVFLLGDQIDAWRPVLWGFAAGLMAVVSVEGLLRPALRSGGVDQIALGLLVGVVFVLVTRWLIHGRDVKAQGLREADVRRSALVFAALFVHSLPEGMAMGAAQASAVNGLNTYIILAIALHHLPEGAVVAIPMASAGFGKRSQFWAAVLTNVPQPISAPLAYLLVDRVNLLLPASLAFAAGAMLAAVVLAGTGSALAGDVAKRHPWHAGGGCHHGCTEYHPWVLAGGRVIVATTAKLRFQERRTTPVYRLIENTPSPVLGRG